MLTSASQRKLRTCTMYLHIIVWWYHCLRPGPNWNEEGGNAGHCGLVQCVCPRKVSCVSWCLPWYTVSLVLLCRAYFNRYYVDGSTDVLWEEWFYCDDLGSQLGPVIKRYTQILKSSLSLSLDHSLIPKLDSFLLRSTKVEVLPKVKSSIHLLLSWIPRLQFIHLSISKRCVSMCTHTVYF